MQLKQHLHRNRMANTCFITAIVAIAVPSYTMTSSISNQSPHNVPHVHMSQRHEKHIKVDQKTLRKCFFAREKQASTPTYTPEIYIYAYSYTCICIYVYIYIYVYSYTKCIQHMHVRRYTDLWVYAYVYIQHSIYIYIYVYVYCVIIFYR